MKSQWFIGLVICVALWSFGTLTAGAASMPVGVLPENSGEITVIRHGENPTNPRLLYEGDRLQGNGLADLDIRWHPGAQGVLASENEMIVTLTIAGEKSWWMKVQQFLGFGAAETKMALNVTRGPRDTALIAPLPGYYVTLIAGETVPFAWGNTTGQTLVFRDEEQKVIFRKVVTGLASIRLSPEEIGLQPGQIYSWMVEGLPGSCNVVLLGADTYQQVAADLRRIDGELGTANEKNIKKAAYLQLVSDVYPYKMDLYWLSYRLLQDSKNLDAKLQESAAMLEHRMTTHLTQPLYHFTAIGK